MPSGPGPLPRYTVRRSSRARRARLTIRDSGEAVVVLPHRAPAAAAHELVVRHGAWIERHQRAIDGRRRALAARPPLGAGRGISLEGIEYRLIVDCPPAERRTIVDHDDRARSITVRRAAADDRDLASVLESWLRGLARRWLSERVSELAGRIGVVPRRIVIRDQRTRWASASPSGTLSFSWRLVLCPPEVLEYVVVHELCHLRVRGHGRDFWSLVNAHVTDAAAARQWLRQHHAEVRHALD